MLNEKDDLSQEAVAAAKKRSRMNALILGVAFLLIGFAPYPWNTFAPLLFLIPVIYSLVNRIRKASAAGTSQQDGTSSWGKSLDGSTKEPYSYTSKDSKDPRRYKAIG